MPMQHRPSYRLIDIELKAVVRLETIIFGMLRDLCFGIGLREGDRVRCEEIGPDSIMLAHRGGRTIRLDREWARFISVSNCDVQTWDPHPPRSDDPEHGLHSETAAHGDGAGGDGNGMMRTLERNRLEQEFGRR